MFLSNKNNDYNVDNLDISLHSGIPKKYYGLKNKNFGDWEIPPWELYIFENKLIGEGTFSFVYLAKWRETIVVAKVFKQNIVIEKKDLILREIDILTKIHHPNIVQFLGYINDPFIIVMEYIPNNNLSYKRTLKLREKINIMKDILKGLAYLHNRKPYILIHRDIKPTNIILTKSKTAKIADFGLSKFFTINKCDSNQNLSSINLSNSNQNLSSINIYNSNQNLTSINVSNSNNNLNTINLSIKTDNLNKNSKNNSSNDLTTNVGTTRYMSPEIHNKSLKYDSKIDIYSCGILLYELFENKKFNLNDDNKWSRFNTPKKIKFIIINHMLNDNPDLRYDALSILKIINNLYKN